MGPSHKILARDDLAERLARERAAGRRVVLCNGVFDLLHVGHVRLLAAARALGDLLVVALNDDASAARRKGPGRPLVPVGERAEVLAALASVDFVTTFPEDTAAETLRLLAPAVHAKGEDYDPAAIPVAEQEAASAVGARLVLAGGPKVASSSALATRLQGRAARPR